MGLTIRSAAEKLRKAAAATEELLAELVYPQDIYCISCGKVISPGRLYAMCDACLSEIHWANGKLCAACGKMLEEWYPDIYCTECIQKLRSFDAGMTCFQYQEKEREIIRALKYHGKGYLARTLSEVLADKVKAMGGRFDLLVPVPMYKKKERQRGYNQAELLAQFTAERLQLPYSGRVLERTRPTSPMNRLTAIERHHNLDGAFAVTEEGRPLTRNRRVLLVDDVYTTGTTAEKCADVLKEAGAESVTVLSLAAGQNQRELPPVEVCEL